MLGMPADVHAPVHAQPPHHSVRQATQHGHPTKRPSVGVKKATKTPARTKVTVTVRPGQTLYSIAREHHSTVAAITKANPKASILRLMPGSKITVPMPKAQVKAARSAERTTNQRIAARQEANRKAGLGPAAKNSSTSSKNTAKRTSPQSASHKPASHKPGTSRPDARKKSASASSAVPHYAGTDAARGFPSDQVAAGDRHREQLHRATLPPRAEIRSMITSTAKRYGVDPKLALAIGWQESTWQQSAVSICDAVGVMQVMPSTSQWAADLTGRDLDRMHAQDNITAGVVTLRYLTEHARDRDEVIGAYYQGLGAMQQHGPYADTKRYIASVNHHMKHLPH